jgi:two-component system sensor histidine kinase UhpB
VDFRAVWPDGSLRWITSRGRGEYDAAGRPVRMTGLMMDITEQKRAEEALRQARDELARANADRPHLESTEAPPCKSSDGRPG